MDESRPKLSSFKLKLARCAIMDLKLSEIFSAHTTIWLYALAGMHTDTISGMY